MAKRCAEIWIGADRVKMLNLSLIQFNIKYFTSPIDLIILHAALCQLFSPANPSVRQNKIKKWIS